MGRTKDQWIQETGGFRIGETPEQFQKRVAEISRLRKKIADGGASATDIDVLGALLGTEDDE